jgi:glutathione S-transferase
MFNQSAKQTRRLQCLQRHLTAAPYSKDFADVAMMEHGVRLTGIPGLYAVVVEYVRYLLHVRGVRAVTLTSPNRKDTTQLYQATRQASIPTLFVDGERPYNAWLEQTYRAASLGGKHAPCLIPAASADRITMFGLMNEIQGEGGLLFNRRFHTAPAEEAGGSHAFVRKYGWTPEAAAQSEDRVVEVLGALHTQLEAQHKQHGSRFFVGGALTALDLQWAAFSNLVAPHPAAKFHWDGPDAPMPLAVFKATMTPRMDAAVTPLLLAHRAFIFKEYLGGGEPFPLK